MLEWARATFDALGTMNARGQAALPSLFEMMRYAVGVRREDLRPDGWAARLFVAADDGRVPAAKVRAA